MARHEKREEGDGVVSVVFKVNLHCSQCAREVQKPLSRTQGVQNVDIDLENGKIMVKGEVDPKKIREQIETTSNKKVEVASVLPMKNQDMPLKKRGDEKNDVKETALRTTVIKVHMHCEKCEYDLKKKILKLKGVQSVNTDPKAQICTINGTIDPQILIKYLHKKVHKYAEIVPQKQEIKKEEKQVAIMDSKKPEQKRSKEDETKENGGEKREELNWNESTVPYFIHYIDAPQMFSDDNPNACSVM